MGKSDTRLQAQGSHGRLLSNQVKTETGSGEKMISRAIVEVCLIGCTDHVHGERKDQG